MDTAASSHKEISYLLLAIRMKSRMTILSCIISNLHWKFSTPLAYFSYPV